MTQPNPITLPQAEVDFHPASFCDDGGRLFTYEGKLYRALLQPGLEVWQALCNSGLGQELIEAGLLIDTKNAGFGVKGFELVVEHHRLPYVSYPAEWCPSMLRDAALRVLEMQYRLIARGLIAIDTNPWNVLFDRGEPVYIDLCSIVLAQDEEHDFKRRFDQFAHYFRNYFNNPLTVAAYGQGQVAREFSRHYDAYVNEEIRNALALGRPVRTMMWQGLQKAVRKLRWRAPDRRINRKDWVSGISTIADRDSVLQMRRWLRHIETLKLPEAEEASSAANSIYPTSVFMDYDADMLEAAAGLLADKRPSTLTSLGGVMPIDAVAEDVPVALTHESVIHIEQMYEQIKQRRSNWLPVLMSLRNPTPAHGGCGSEFASAAERFSSDIVLALGTLFDLYDRHTLTLEQIADTFSQFSQRGLIVDFTSQARRSHASTSRSTDWAPYTLEHWIDALSKRFSTIEKVLQTDDGSALLWCEHTKQTRNTTEGAK